MTDKTKQRLREILAEHEAKTIAASVDGVTLPADTAHVLMIAAIRQIRQLAEEPDA